jgi:PfaD family protein
MLVRAPAQKGWHIAGSGRQTPDRTALIQALQQLDKPLSVVQTDAGPAVVRGGQAVFGEGPAPSGSTPLLAWIPSLTPDQLGDPAFRQTYGVRVNYVCGAMANGIGSTDIVIAMAKAGMMGFFGAAGLAPERVRAAIEEIQAEVSGLPFGINLIHSPAEPWREQATVDLLLEKGVHTVSASAYLRLTPMVVEYRVKGIRRGADGIVVPNRILAKISREEVAIHFLLPPPQKMLDALLSEGRITPEEAELALHIPMADDLTAEADSGGHTDNQAAPVLLPLICALRDRVQAERNYDRPVRVGAAGGISTPPAVVAAFSMGAAYVMTGSINQACVEAGTSPMVKDMLATATVGDVGMAPASDMFEAGVQVQVLKRGTMFAARGSKLYEIYRTAKSLDALTADENKAVERILGRPVADVWADCVSFFSERDPEQLERANGDPKHKMALVFRWYLGMSSRWAIGGDTDRRMDTQIWCGPSIGSFNDWTKGTFLAAPAERKVVVVAANLMAGAAALTRARWLLQQGVDAGPEATRWTPRPLAE